MSSQCNITYLFKLIKISLLTYVVMHYVISHLQIQ